MKLRQVRVDIVNWG